MHDPFGASPLVASFVAELAGPEPPPASGIHPDDEMYAYGLDSLRGCSDAAAILYFSKGHQIAWTAGEVARWISGGTGGAIEVLDFAAGYGRGTRWLARGAPGRLWAAEIDPGAVQFHESVLGVPALESPSDPERFEPGRRFDLIFAASFFSHLPADRFERWLGRLFELLSPGGAVAFSVHGPALQTDAGADWTSGIVFRPQSETRRLDGSEYGTSWVTEEFVRRIAARACGAEAPVSLFSFALCGDQDLYVVLRPPVPDRPPLEVSAMPRGALDLFEIEDGVVRVGGWAECGRETPPAVRLRSASEILESSPGCGEAGTRRRWSFRFPDGRVGPDEVVRIEAVSGRGIASVLAMGTLRPHLSNPR
jgi:SAM-dependent methyltransferase